MKEKVDIERINDDKDSGSDENLFGNRIMKTYETRLLDDECEYCNNNNQHFKEAKRAITTQI